MFLLSVSRKFVESENDKTLPSRQPGSPHFNFPNRKSKSFSKTEVLSWKILLLQKKHIFFWSENHLDENFVTSSNSDCNAILSNLAPDLVAKSRVWYLTKVRELHHIAALQISDMRTF